ncbi:MAG: hypothetical protein K2G61_01920 [Bacteroidaceae bacterium]|nr:hypothetical protein [Bacteroidaceae bacterium]
MKTLKGEERHLPFAKIMAGEDNAKRKGETKTKKIKNMLIDKKVFITPASAFTNRYLRGVGIIFLKRGLAALKLHNKGIDYHGY